jgi:hypothetical protein
MNDNPYAPPGAAVADVIAPAAVYAEPPFFAVSLLKLFLMSVCTFGIYELFWFSRHWKAIEKRERRSLNPYLRAVLCVFFCYPCFARIRDYDSGPGGSTLWAGPLATGFVVTTLMTRLPERYVMLGVLLQPVCLVVVQRRANEVNAASAPSHYRNDVFSAWNWVALVVGGFILSAATVALIVGGD